MKVLLFCAFIFSLTACSTIHYKDGDSEFTRTSFGTKLNIQSLLIEKTSDGKKTMQVRNTTSDQVEALRAVTEAAVQGAMKAVKP